MAQSSLHESSRESLIKEARRLGVVRPEVFTRAELQDEIVKRCETDPKKQKQARGLLGLARDLLASVVEKGLHLPDVAERLRGSAPPVVPAPREPMATVTLAEIYVAQGHPAKAKKVLQEVLSAEPSHELASALMSRLAEPTTPSGVSTVGGSSKPAARPAPMLDETPLNASYGVDEVVAMPVDPTTALVYWETSRPVRDTEIELELTHASGRVESRHIFVGTSMGEHVAHDLPPGARLKARLSSRRGGDIVERAVATAATPRSTVSALVAAETATFHVDGARPVVAPMPRQMAMTLALAASATPRTTRKALGGSSDWSSPFSDTKPAGSSPTAG